jgi:hypothetical protein
VDHRAASQPTETKKADDAAIRWTLTITSGGNSRQRPEVKTTLVVVWVSERTRQQIKRENGSSLCQLRMHKVHDYLVDEP